MQLVSKFNEKDTQKRVYNSSKVYHKMIKYTYHAPLKAKEVGLLIGKKPRTLT